MYSVLKFQSPFERLKQYSTSPEENLYKAILTQAIIDITNISSSCEARRHEVEAKNWIFGQEDSFLDACQVAKIRPEFVRRIAKEAIVLQLKKKYSFNKSRRAKKKKSCKENSTLSIVC